MKGRKYAIDVSVESSYVPEQSSLVDKRFVFSYTVTLFNGGAVSAQLLSRHWIILDSDGGRQEVRGEGVVGMQPYLKPGESFQYTSGSILHTPAGSMEGSYQMVADDGATFDAPIPVFALVGPMTLH
ncbi:MAG: Co2+/Mg2+ efflux protein ApaG [Magnetococcales bacterium]|nr:Co2+/Mg2+ efflux protein ApaG [Magnetococcales bacterium]